MGSGIFVLVGSNQYPPREISRSLLLSDPPTSKHAFPRSERNPQNPRHVDHLIKNIMDMWNCPVNSQMCSNQKLRKTGGNEVARTINPKLVHVDHVDMCEPIVSSNSAQNVNMNLLHTDDNLRSIDNDSTQFHNRYELLNTVIGYGAKSVVKLCRYRSAEFLLNGLMAVKVVDRTLISDDDVLALRREASIMRELRDHKQIVHMIDFFEEEFNIYLVMEYVPGGELFQQIVRKRIFHETEARMAVARLLEVVAYIHDKDIVHRDIKPENILLQSEYDATLNIKVADFGFAVKVKGNTLTTECGSPGYIAPEILENHPYGKSVDMWSVGVLTYVLLSGYPPFYDENRKYLNRKIKRGDFHFHQPNWNSISSKAKDFISHLLVIDHHKRFTAAEALDHLWIKNAEIPIPRTTSFHLPYANELQVDYQQLSHEKIELYGVDAVYLDRSSESTDEARSHSNTCLTVEDIA